MPTHPTIASSYLGKFHSALGSIPLGDVDLKALERLDQSPELDPYLDPDAPKILYTLVQTHIKSNPGRAIFDDRYGLVCVQILIRLIRVIACAHSNILGYFKGKLDSQFMTTDMLQILVNHTADLVMGYRESAENREAVTILFEKTRGLFSHKTLADLLDILWRDRKQFFVLCGNGSLPGVSLLLYMLWEQINSLGIMNDRNLVSRLRDLVFRCYLVTSSGDQRNAMRLLCIHMYKAYNAHEEESKPYDPTDSLAIIRAYNQSLAFVQVDLDPLSGVKLDMYRYLLEFTSDLSAVSSTSEELPLIASTAIERLWMAFDHEKWEHVIPPGNPTSQVMYYMGDLVYALGALLGRIQASRQPPRAFLDALAQSDWPNIMARYMLLNFRTPVFLEFPAYSLRQLPVLFTSVLDFLPISREAFVDSYCDWLKVVSHMRLLQGSRPQGDVTISYVLEALGAWVRWGNAVGFAGIKRGPREVALDVTAAVYKVDCMNPRCIGGLSTRLCGRCGVARYCSLKCQNDDWTSSFPDSHRKRCEAKSDRSN